MDRIAHDFEYAYSIVNEGHQPPPHVLTWDKTIRDIRARGVLKSVHIAPTGCLKSSTNNTHALQYLLRGANPHCLFGTQSPAVRKRTVRLIRDICKDLYGREGELWEAHQFELPGLDSKARDPNFFGASAGATIEGLRYDKGIGDDISDGKSEYSEPARVEVERWLLRTFLLRLNEGSPCDIWGSFWSEDDILMTLIRQGWETHIWPLFGEVCPADLEKYPNVHHHGGDYEYLWRARHEGMTPEEYRAREFKTIQTFNLRDQCNPFGARGRVFDPSTIMEVDRPTDIEDRFEWHIGHDPRDTTSTGGKVKDSEESIVVLGYDPKGEDKNGNKGVLYVYQNPAGYWEWLEVERQCRDIIENINVHVWTIERSPIAGGHIGWLKAHSGLGERRVSEQLPGGNKDARINSLEPHVRSGKIRFLKGRCEELIQQALAHPGGKKKDRIDSLEVGARRLLEEGTRPEYVVHYG